MLHFLNYYIEHINKESSFELAFYLSFIYCFAKIKDKNWWHKYKEEEKINPLEKLLPKDIYEPTFDLDKIENISNIYSESYNTNHLNNLITFWKEQKQKSLFDLKLKFVSELIVLWIKDNKEEFEKDLESLLKSNDFLMSIKNSKDLDIQNLCYILNDNINEFCKSNSVADGLIIECKQQIQFSNFHTQFINKNYLLFILKENELNNLDKLKLISKFIGTNKYLRQVFANFLLDLETTNKSYYKKLKPILMTILCNSVGKKYAGLENAIVSYFVSYKITNTKEKIETLKKESNMDIHRIFLSLTKQTNNLLLRQNNVNLFDQYPQQEKEITNVKLCLINELAYIEELLNEQIFLVNETQMNEGIIQIKQVYPTNKFNFKPFIIYNYYTKIDNINQTYKYANKNYQLQGIITLNNQFKYKQILIKNKYNSYWYSAKVSKWEEMFGTFSPIEENTDILCIYCLNEKNYDSINFSCKELLLNVNEHIPITEWVGRKLEWLMQNGIHEFKKNHAYFEKAFTFNQILNSPNIQWNNEKKKQLIDLDKIKGVIGLVN